MSSRPPNLVNPVFIIGTGRCGSTVFYDVLSKHEHIAWLSVLNDRYPHLPSLQKRFLRFIDAPILGSYLKAKVKPIECYNFWAYHYKGFRRPLRDLVALDVTPQVKASLHEAFSEIITPRRHLLAVKITGWPRIGFLQEVFKDAKFIHIVRDGRAVANSMLKVDFWNGWQGPQNWRWGALSEIHHEAWLQTGRSFIALAGIQWKILIEAVLEARKSVSDADILEVKYEDMCSNPIPVFKQVIDFCGVPWTPHFEKTLGRLTFKNMNFKWKEDLSDHQKMLLESVVRPYLTAYGYEA